MLAGTALYIHLLVYVGLSLFIINGLYVFMVVCVVYAYNLTWGGLKNGKKRGRAKRVLSCFCRIIKERHCQFRIAPLSFELFQEIFCDFRLVYSQSISDWFSAHIRPVIHVDILTCCFNANIYVMYNSINTIYSLI